MNKQNNPLEISVVKVTPEARMPFKATVGSAGYDLYCTRTEITQGGTCLTCHSDIALEIPEGYCALVFSRSSIACRGMVMTNGVGVVDSDFRGELTPFFSFPTTPHHTYHGKDFVNWSSSKPPTPISPALPN